MNITIFDILNIMKLQSTGYKAELRKYAEEKNIKLPDILCDFIDRAANNPFFETADVWTGKPVLYSEWLEKIEGEIPKAMEEYLLIGSDCGAGVAVFGIKSQDLGMDNPPVYFRILPFYFTVFYEECKYGFLWKIYRIILGGKRLHFDG